VPAAQRQKRALPTVSQARRAPGDEAVRKALASLARGGEGTRIGLIGNTGSGKTVAAVALAQAYLAASPGALIVVDNKAERRFDHLPGATVFPSVAAFATSPPPSGSRVWIFRPSIFEGGEVSPEEVAAFQWRLAGRRWPSLAINDELVPHAARNGQWRKGFEWLPRAFVQGRSHKISEVWGTTALQDVPLASAGQSELWVWQTAGVALRLLRERDYLIGVPPGLVENLPGFNDAPELRGDFVSLRSGVPWDGCIYKF
jgi:hypothetical protein